jgi:DNA-directed RNA polymerase specialized sigma24 family protein
MEMTGSWQLRESSFERLLQELSPDRERAAAEYERLRFRLTKFFEWRDCPEPEILADCTLDRLARRLEDGEQIGSIYSYCCGIARMLLLEVQRDRERQAQMLSQIGMLQTRTPNSVEAVPLDALLKCLEHLTEHSRRMVLDYYQGEKQAMIDRRKALADSLRIPMNALRLRVNRIRMHLENCVKKAGEHE